MGLLGFGFGIDGGGGGGGGGVGVELEWSGVEWSVWVRLDLPWVVDWFFHACDFGEDHVFECRLC